MPTTVAASISLTLSLRNSVLATGHCQSLAAKYRTTMIPTYLERRGDLAVATSLGLQTRIGRVEPSRDEVGHVFNLPFRLTHCSLHVYMLEQKLLGKYTAG